MTHERLVQARGEACGALKALLHIGAHTEIAAARVRLDVIDLLLAIATKGDSRGPYGHTFHCAGPSYP